MESNVQLTGSSSFATGKHHLEQPQCWEKVFKITNEDSESDAHQQQVFPQILFKKAVLL